MIPNSLSPVFRLDALSGFTAAAIGLFFILTTLYSSVFMKKSPRSWVYYVYLLLTALASAGCVLANNLILLLFLWGFLGLLLYLLINKGEEDASVIAKKSLIMVGGSDVLMVFGGGIIVYLSGSLRMDHIRLPLDNAWAITAYVCMAIASFTKAGIMPFHSWIPECCRKAPAPVVAFLPASLDKLLGIYLLARISLDLFVMNQAMNLLLMVIGAFTILSAVMMALIQHNMKKLLGFHAVSQVGYMVLGIGTGSPLGIAGALFHMLNHAIYKSCLFLTAGNVEYRTGTTELEKLGGLARWMPMTYVSCLIASLSIVGVPPFNGFFSKWMIYQGLIESISSAGRGRILVVFCLVAAMFGSGLTLASFMKLLHAVFLGQKSSLLVKKREEVPWAMWLPCVILAALCVIFGIFADQLPLKYLILPAIGAVTYPGIWTAGLAAGFLITGLLIGLLIFNSKGLKQGLRPDEGFIGGEPMDLSQNRVTGQDFYKTVEELGVLKGIYAMAEKGSFDIYVQGEKVFSISRIIVFLHNGVLPTYLVWVLVGMIGLLFALVR